VIDCANEAAQLVVAPFTLQAGVKLVTEPGIPDQNRFGTVNFPMTADAYPFQKSIQCEEQASCCTDVIDSNNIRPVNICEGSSYTLPDNTVVKTSGTYFAVYKIPGGCDSIKFYKVVVSKNPSELTLGSDKCLDRKDSITLTATRGYENYYWMNRAATADNEFRIGAPGEYEVRVTNICGSKTATISVFKECDFPIFMPSAFTPNGDGKNDVFKLPAQNKNTLTSLKIFNRWGQLIFYTSDATKGWDGNVNNFQQATGVFIYFVEMQGISGNKLTQRGTVLLLR
jgi:gliding motility-associated-like protein